MWGGAGRDRPVDAATLLSPRAPWETRPATLPAAPSATIAARGTRPAPVRVAAPIAIPVVGAPIKGRHLVRAPWTEPLSAFAGVIVETQLVPDDWYKPRSAADRVMDAPIPAAPPLAPRPLVAIPIVPEHTAAPPVPARAAATTVPVRVVPVMVGARDAAPRPTVAPTPRPVPVLTSLGTVSTAIARTSAAPVEPVVPSMTPVTPAPARRGMLGRAVALTVGLVVSLVAYEAAARMGRR